MSYPSSLKTTGSGSEGMNLEVWFLQPNEVSVFLESSFADLDDERLYETMLFALFASRHLANGSGKFNYVSLAEVLFSLDEHEPLPEVVEHLDDAGEVRLVSPTSGGGRKGFTCALRPEKRAFFKLHPHGFGMLGKGVDYYAPTSTLALLAWLLSRRQGDDRYQLALGTTAKMIGAAGVSGQIGVTSQSDIALRAASAGWMHPDDLIPEGEAVSDEVRKICAKHDIEFGSLYAEARRQLAEASESKGVGEEELASYEPGVRRMCRIVVATAGLSSDESQLLLDIAARLTTFAQDKGDGQMTQDAYGFLDSQLGSAIEEAGLTPVVEALEGMIQAIV